MKRRFVTRKIGGRARKGATRCVAISLLVMLLGAMGGWWVEGWGHPAWATQAASLWTCGMHPQVIRDSPGTCPICGMQLTPLKAEHGSSEGVVEIDPRVVQNMGLRTAAVLEAPLYTRVRAVGYLVEPESSQLDINLRVSGWIEKLYANVEGMHVQAGQPLFDLYSRELQVATEEWIAARRLAKARGEEGSMGEMVESARRKLLSLGLAPDYVEKLGEAPKAPATFTIVSPMAGHVTEKAIYAGGAVQAGERVLRLSNRSTMWLDLQLYEQDLPLVRDGEIVTATVSALPGRHLQGPIEFVHPHLDPLSRTARARVILPNSDGSLRQGMFASAEIRALVAERALQVPREAVLDTGIRQLVFIAQGEGRFEPREVSMGASGEDGFVRILEGLRPGETVVTSGQFLLDGESRLREAIRKHLSERSSGPGEGAEESHDSSNP